MKWISFRFLALPLMTILLLGSAPSVRAIVFQDSAGYGRVKDDNDKKKKKKDQVPEGSTGAILVLAAGVLGGGMLVWRRKKGSTVA